MKAELNTSSSCHFEISAFVISCGGAEPLQQVGKWVGKEEVETSMALLQEVGGKGEQESLEAGRVGEGCFRVRRAIYRLAKVGGGREVEDLGKEKLVDEIRIQRKGMDGARD